MPTEDFTLTVSFPFFVIVSYSEYTPLLDHQLSIVSPSKRWTIDGLSMDYRWIIDGQSSLLLPANILSFSDEKMCKKITKVMLRKN
jgi:hypothetical protein